MFRIRSLPEKIPLQDPERCQLRSLMSRQRGKQVKEVEHLPLAAQVGNRSQQ
jgi:hypothetical protein